MPTLYHANARTPSRGTYGADWNAIVATTHATPIEVTTFVPHLLATGDCVEQVGCADPNANGTFQITRIDAGHYYLQNSIGTLAGGQYGNARQIAVDPTMQLPSDGDLVNAASIALVGEGASDVTPWLYQRTGKYRLVDQYYLDNTNNEASPPVPWANWGGVPGTTALVSANSWQAICAGLLATFEGGTVPGYVNTPGLAPYDLLDISIAMDAVFSTAATPGTYLASNGWAVQTGIGIAYDGGASPSIIAGSECTLVPAYGSLTPTEYASTLYSPGLRMRGTWTPGNNAHRSFDVFPMAILRGSGFYASAVKVTPCGVVEMVINHYRIN